MKKIKALGLLLALALICSSSVYAQIEVYNSLEDYQNGVSTSYDGIDFQSSSKFITFMKGDQETKMFFKNFWGFKTDGEVLWRCTTYKGMQASFVKLMHSVDGSFYYFEYGEYHMAQYLKRGMYYPETIVCHVATTIEGDLTRIYHRGKIRGQFEEWGNSNPKFKPFVECVLNNKSSLASNWKEVRPCLDQISE